MVNLGNTCYMNSALQCFLATPEVVDYFLHYSEPDAVICREFAFLVKMACSGQSKYFSPISFKDTFGEIHREFYGARQQDCQEFITVFMESLHRELLSHQVEPNQEKTVISETFYGQLQYQVTCLSCNHVSTSLDPFSCLPIPFPTSESINLHACLAAFSKGEVLDSQRFCPTCKKMQAASKSVSIWTLPDTLIVCLKRFAYVGSTSTSPHPGVFKLNQPISFPISGLDLAPFLSGPSKEEGEQLFDLYGTVSHHGLSAFSGHYTAKTKRPLTNSWNEFDDAWITPCGPMGGEQSDAYVLFYRRREESGESTINFDELMKIPNNPKENFLDQLDDRIAEKEKVHALKMAAIDEELASIRMRKREEKDRRKTNAMLRDQLKKEVTKDVLKAMFSRNKTYLKKVWSGEVESERHKKYHKGIKARQELLYQMITDPFTDDQLEWTLQEISSVWMKNTKEYMDNNEYVWKVLLPETFIKFYMDHFGVEKEEAEFRISETPLGKQENGIADSDEE